MMGEGALRSVQYRRELLRCHHGVEAPRLRARSREAPSRPPHSESTWPPRRGGAAPSPGRRGAGPPSAEPVHRRSPLGVPDGGAALRALFSRLRRAGAGDPAPAWEPWSSWGREVVKRRPRDIRRRLPRIWEPRPSAIAASGCRLFLYSLPPSPAFRACSRVRPYRLPRN